MTKYHIPYLDVNPQQCAYSYIDTHVKSMTLDIALILSAFNRRLKSDAVCNVMGYYRIHETTNYFDWLYDSKENYDWLWDLFGFLCAEHSYRFNKAHIAEEQYHILKNYPILIGTPRLVRMQDTKKFSPPLVITPRQFWLDDNKRPWTPDTPPPNAVRIATQPKRSQLNTARAWYKATYAIGGKYTNVMKPRPLWLTEGTEDVAYERNTR